MESRLADRKNSRIILQRRAHREPHDRQNNSIILSSVPAVCPCWLPTKVASPKTLGNSLLSPFPLVVMLLKIGFRLAKCLFLSASRPKRRFRKFKTLQLPIIKGPFLSKLFFLLSFNLLSIKSIPVLQKYVTKEEEMLIYYLLILLDKIVKDTKCILLSI